MSQNLAKKWLVAQIRPNSHDLAIRNLERQGFEVFQFNPCCKKPILSVLDEVKKTPYGVFRGQIIISGGYQLHYNYLLR